MQADDAELEKALRWLVITMDQLVTRQRGDGIYAGLPWFNEYWGRDSFIALPGALLVTGLEEVGGAAEVMGFIAVLLASINVFGGFLVTNRMLSMFKKKDK